jgi:phosphate transport system substrate-binding protein
MKLPLAILCSALCAAMAVPAAALATAPVPHYKPDRHVSGTIRIWGDEYMAGVTRYWAEGFRKYHPQTRFEFKLKGSGAAMPGIYHNVADLALLGRETDLTDDNGFFKSVGGYAPLRLELMNGSLTEPDQSAAPAVFVHRDNPLAKLTVVELDAIFGHEHRRGTRNIRTWGELGLTGEWKDQPIMLYAVDAESEAGVHFTRTVLAESRKMNWEHLTEFSDLKNPDGSRLASGQQIIDALRKDRYGLAIDNIRYANQGVKALAIAANEAAPYYHASRANIISRKYPLARRTYAFVNRQPGKPVAPAVREFLRYVLSREGQQDIVREHGYLPLGREVLLEQLKNLD